MSLGNIDIYLYVLSFVNYLRHLKTETAQVVEIRLADDKDARIQGISIHGVGLVHPEYSDFTTGTDGAHRLI